VDRDLGPMVGRALREAGLDVRLHQEIFRESDAQDSVADELWIEHCGTKGWVALTRDNEICRTAPSVAAAMRSGARVLILRGQLPFPELAGQFVSALPLVERFLDAHPDAFIARVTRETFRKGGKAFKVVVKLVVDLAKWTSAREQSSSPPPTAAPS
jgi:hypothetical protein